MPDKTACCCREFRAELARDRRKASAAGTVHCPVHGSIPFDCHGAVIPRALALVHFTVRRGESIDVLCRIVGIEDRYFGRIDWLVEPVSGSGKTWVDSRRCKRAEDP